MTSPRHATDQIHAVRSKLDAASVTLRATYDDLAALDQLVERLRDPVVVPPTLSGLLGRAAARARAAELRIVTIRAELAFAEETLRAALDATRPDRVQSQDTTHHEEIHP